MDCLSSQLKEYFGEDNVKSIGCIHQLYLTRDHMGHPMNHVTLSDLISYLQSFADLNNLQLKEIELGGACVYTLEGDFIGTLVIHLF